MLTYQGLNSLTSHHMQLHPSDPDQIKAGDYLKTSPQGLIKCDMKDPDAVYKAGEDLNTPTVSLSHNGLLYNHHRVPVDPQVQLMIDNIRSQLKEIEERGSVLSSGENCELDTSKYLMVKISQGLDEILEMIRALE